MASLIATAAMIILMAAGLAGSGNHPPVAVDDHVEVRGYTEYLEIPVFANDWDPDGDPLQVVAALTPDRGKSALLKGGAIAVAPDWSLMDHDGALGPALIAHGFYIVSDGLDESKAECFVWH